MSLVGRINRQLERKTVLQVDVREHSLLPVLDDSALSLDVVDQSLFVEHRGDGVDAIGEQVQVNVAAGADVARQDAADQGRGRNGPRRRIRRRASTAHFAEMAGPLRAFVQAGERLNLVANFGVRRQIGRLDPGLANAVGGLLRRGNTPLPRGSTSDGRLPRRSAAAACSVASQAAKCPTRAAQGNRVRCEAGRQACRPMFQ